MDNSSGIMDTMHAEDMEEQFLRVDTSEDGMVSELRSSVHVLTMRGLRSSAKFAAELLVSITSQDGENSSSSRERMQPTDAYLLALSYFRSDEYARARMSSLEGTGSTTEWTT